MNAAAVLRRITVTIGDSEAQRSIERRLERRRLPVLRCPMCRAAVVSAGVTMLPRPCEGRCGRRVDRTAQRGRCPGCLATLRTEEARSTTVPHRHMLATFGSAELTAWCRDREAIRRAQAFAEAPPDGCRILLVTGPTGSGKSSLVSATVQHLRTRVRRGARVSWTDARVIARTRRDHPLGHGEPSVILQALAADITVVDDLGKELVYPPHEAADVVQLLELRHAGDRRSRVPPGALDIITTELPVQLNDADVEAGPACEPGRSLTHCYPLSFVRRIAGTLRGAEVVRGSAVVINVRKCP